MIAAACDAFIARIADRRQKPEMPMTRPRGRPRQQPEDMVYLRLAVTPQEHRQFQVAAGLAGKSMAQFARTSVAENARRILVAGGLDPDRLPQPEPERGQPRADPGGAGAQGGRKAKGSAKSG
jgi:hypothetical protein